MTQAQLDHDVAEATGESIRAATRMGFSAAPDVTAGREPEPLYLVVDCPHRRGAALYPGRLADGSHPMAECPGCDALFGFDVRDVYVGRPSAVGDRNAVRTDPPHAARPSRVLVLINCVAVAGRLVLNGSRQPRPRTH